jgi:D-amino peptidase
MKVYLATDLEGVSGVTNFLDETYSTGKYFEKAKKLLTAEINAAVEGLLEAGATDILVLDGHGPGAVLFEDLHPAAKLLHGRPLAPASVRNEIVKTYDVGIMLGQHAMAGTIDGTLNHTQNSQSIDYFKLNGKVIGEIAQFALHCGALGLPMVCLTGDEAACREAEELIPGIPTVAVKKGLSRTSAISLAPAEAHRLIREGVRNALNSHRKNPMKPLVWPGPYVLEKRYFVSNTADGDETVPNATRIDSQTVQLKSENILDIIYT